MIAKLTGIIAEIEPGKTIIDVNGVGYKVFISNTALEQLIQNQGESVSLFIYSAIRDTAFDLYGFTEKEDQDFFELLLTISGIGPKSALQIINTAPVETLKEGILTGDATYLTKISGIGKKNAEKIILSLKDKVGSIENDSVNTEGGGMAIEALVGLGYSEREAREVIQKIGKGGTTEEILKEALKQLGKA